MTEREREKKNTYNFIRKSMLGNLNDLILCPLHSELKFDVRNQSWL